MFNDSAFQQNSCCRVCLEHHNEKTATYIFDIIEEIPDKKISELLEICGGLLVDELDQFPKNICDVCLNQLRAAAIFREKCETTSRVLSLCFIEKVLNPEDNNNIEDNAVVLDLNDIDEPEKNKVNVDVISNFEDISNTNDLNTYPVKYLYKFSKNFGYTCDSCGSAFKVLIHLKKHIKCHEKMVYGCIFCYYPFTIKENLDKHMTEFHKDEHLPKDLEFSDCLSENNFLEEKEDNVENTIETKKKFLCRQCGMSFVSNAGLSDHIKTHTGVKPFECDECGKRFAQKGNLKLHTRTHTGDRPYCCVHCKKTFSNSSNLSTHLRSHANSRPHKCIYCKASFTRVNLLQDHLRTHTGEKPFKCQICEKQFSRKNSLRDHYKIHTGERPYKCKMCNKGFIRSSQLRIHGRIHQGFDVYDYDTNEQTISEFD